MSGSEYKFEAAELIDLFEAVGRRDAAAYSFSSDLEAAIRSYLALSVRGIAVTPGEALKRADWAARLSDELVSVLGAIRGDIEKLQAAQPVPQLLERRIGNDVAQAVDALADLRLALGDLAQHVLELRGGAEPEDALLEAAARAYRNRLNRRPTAESEGDFRRVVEASLRRAAARVPALHRVLAVLTQARLVAVIERLTPARASAAPIELKLAAADT